MPEWLDVCAPFICFFSIISFGFFFLLLVNSKRITTLEEKREWKKSKQ